MEEGPSGDELREAQIKLEEHRLGLDHDISQRIDSQIVNRRLSDYQHHFDNPLMDPIDPPSRTTLFMAGGSGSSSSELFESSFDSGCPPDYTGTNCFTSSLPSCTPPPPKSPSPITGRISRVSQGRRASDGGPRLLFCQQGSGDRPSKQRSIQDSGKARGHLDLVHLRPPSTPPDNQQQFKMRGDSGTQLQLLVQQRMLQQKRNLYHRHRGGGSPTPIPVSTSSTSRRADHVPRQDSYKLAQRTQILPPLSQGHVDRDFDRDRKRDEERWKSLPSRLAADCQLAERSLIWSQQVNL